MISQNNKTGSDEAIEVKNSARGDLFVYASHGKVSIKNDVFINGAVGYEIEVKNSAHVDAGADPINIPSTGGSDGEFSLDSWLEI